MKIPATLIGVGLMLAAALFGSSMNALVKHVSTDIHPFEVAFFRNAFSLFVLLPMLLTTGLNTLRTERLGLHSVRGLLNVVAMLCFFYGISITPLASVAALGFTAPLFATLLAGLFLHEQVGPRRIIALIIGFLGALIIIRPGFAGFALGEALILFSALLWAIALNVIKRLSSTESSLTITIFAMFFLAPSTLVAALPHWVMPDWTSLAWLMGVAILGSSYQLCIAQSLKLADISQVLPADFTKLLWSAFIGWSFFTELPDAPTWIGGLMIVGAVSYVTWRETQLTRKENLEN